MAGGAYGPEGDCNKSRFSPSTNKNTAPDLLCPNNADANGENDYKSMLKELWASGHIFPCHLGMPQNTRILGSSNTMLE